MNKLRRDFPSYFLYKLNLRKVNKMKCEYQDRNCFFYNNKNCTRKNNQKCLKEIDNSNKIKKDAKSYWDKLRKK